MIQVRQSRADLVDDPTVDGQGHMAHTPYEHVACIQVGMHDARVAFGQDHRVQVRPDREEPGGTAGERLVEFGDDVRLRCHLLRYRDRHVAGRNRAPVGRAECDQGVHPFVATEVLDVVAAHDSAHGVPDHVHPFVSGLAADLFDQRSQSACHGPDVLRQRRVVQRHDPTEAAPAQSAAQQREDRAVVHDPVQQDDRGARGLDVADQQTTLHRRQTLEVVVHDLVPGLLLGQPQGVHDHMGCEPRDLDRRSADSTGAQQAGGSSARAPADAADAVTRGRGQGLVGHSCRT